MKLLSAILVSVSLLAQQQQPNFRKEAEANPASAEAQSNYIISIAREAEATPEKKTEMLTALRTTYEDWAKKNATVAVMQWSLGTVCMMLNDPAAAKHFQDAAAIDPKFIPAYKGLATSSTLINDVPGHRQALQKINELNPKDYGAQYELINTYVHDDPAKFIEMAKQFVAQNPNLGQSGVLLATIADSQPTMEKRIAMWEQLRKDYVQRPNPLPGLPVAMKSLFEVYAASDPAKALALAEEEQKAYPGLRQWGQVVAYQKSLMSAQALIRDKKFEEATAALEKLQAPWGMSQSEVELARANAAIGQNEGDAAYAALLKSAGRRPTPRMMVILNEVGAKLGKSSTQVSEDFWKSLIERNTPMRDFSLNDSKSGKAVTLSSLRGKVVLVHFWHPSCAACRVELPYVQKLAQKYQGQRFEWVNINTFPSEEKLVPNWMASSLLAPDEDWAKEQYNVSFNPTNFLIDGEGRIIFKPELQTFETLELAAHEVDLLLARLK